MCTKDAFKMFYLNHNHFKDVLFKPHGKPVNNNVCKTAEGEFPHDTTSMCIN